MSAAGVSQASSSGDGFRDLFLLLADMPGSLNSALSISAADWVMHGVTALQCVACSPLQFYETVYPATSGKGYMERARVYLLYKHVWAAAEESPAELAERAAEQAVRDLQENPNGRFWQILAGMDREEALHTLAREELPRTQALRDTIARELGLVV